MQIVRLCAARGSPMGDVYLSTGLYCSVCVLFTIHVSNIIMIISYDIMSSSFVTVKLPIGRD